MSFSLFDFEPPATVAPGEYLVSCHERYQQTPLNGQWHNEYDTMVASALAPETESYHVAPDSSCGSSAAGYIISISSSSSSSPATSRSPSPSSIFDSSYEDDDSDSDAEMSTPPSSPVSKYHNLPPKHARSKSNFSKKRKTYRRAAAAEAKVAPQKAVAAKTERVREKKIKANASASAKGTAAVVCFWGGCGEDIEYAKDLWKHIEDEHGLEELGDTVRDGGEEEEEEEDGNTGRKRQPVAGSSKQAAAYSRQKQQIMVRCRWDGCDTRIQFAGIRRHVESRHTDLRKTACPHFDCDFTTVRPDMMYRHVVHCSYK